VRRSESGTLADGAQVFRDEEVQVPRNVERLPCLTGAGEALCGVVGNDADEQTSGANQALGGSNCLDRIQQMFQDVPHDDEIELASDDCTGKSFD